MLTKSTKVRMGLMGFAAAVALAGCFGADKVASPGVGGYPPSSGGGSSSGSSDSGSSGSSGAAAGCPTGTTDVGVIANLRNCQLPSEILGALELQKLPGVVYSLSGRVAVGRDLGPNPASPLTTGASGTLTIRPGVKIFGSQGLDYLIIERGSKIYAEGSATDPIIFTSRQSILGQTIGSSIGQWGGLVISGRAPNASCPAGVTPPNIACSEAQLEGTNSFYGGNSPADDSGVLKYVRVQHSGYKVTENNELNGITFGGVGTGTTVEYVQVHNSSDDGIELFGGTVNLKHIVLTGNDDDSLDTDTGYRGSIQFLIIRQRADDGVGDRGDRVFEMSSAGNHALYSHPKIANATLINRGGKSGTQALELNSGTRLTLINSVLHNGGTYAAGSERPGIRADGAATLATNLTFQSVFMSGFATPFQNTVAGTAFNAGVNNTSNGTSTLDGFVNGSNESGVTVANVTSHSSFFTQTDYIGAVKNSSDNWWKGWTCDLDSTVC